MKIEAVNLLSPNQPMEAEITHQGESVRFVISNFTRNAFTKQFNVFNELNLYLDQLPQDRQSAIFALFIRARNEFDDVLSKNNINTALKNIIKHLIDLINYQEIKEWTMLKAPISVPENKFKSQYKASVDDQGSREQTYTRLDYLELVAMAILFRCLIPIWGEFISQTRKEAGTTWKEFYALELLDNSSINDEPPMHKLQQYIEATVGDKKHNPESIINGISSEDFNIWLLSLVIIRRLCIGDIRGIDPTANIVTFIYSFVAQKMLGGDASESSVKEKTTQDTTSELGDKTSVFERYKLKHDLSPGEIAEIEFSIDNIVSTAFRLSANMTEDLIMNCLVTSQQLMNEQITNPQITLARWVLAPVVKPRGVLYLNKKKIVECLALTEAVLWARGHKYLSLLATSFPLVSDNVLYVSSTDSKARISKELVDQLDIIYPCQKVSGGVRTGFKNVNPVIKTIDLVTDEFSSFSLIATADKSKVEEVLGKRHTNRINIAFDIKIQMAQLIVEIGNRSWK